MNYTAALRGEHGPLWRDTFAARDLKVWNDARIVHDLYVDGSIHCDGFAIPAVSYDNQVINKTLRVKGEGIGPEDVSVLFENGIVEIGQDLVVHEAIGCAAIAQYGEDNTSEYEGSIWIGNNLTVEGTINHSGKFNPPLTAAPTDVYTKKECNDKFAEKAALKTVSDTVGTMRTEVTEIEKGNLKFPYLQTVGTLHVGDAQKKGGSILLNGVELPSAGDVTKAKEDAAEAVRTANQASTTATKAEQAVTALSDGVDKAKEDAAAAVEKVESIVAGTQTLSKALVGRGAKFADAEVLHVKGDAVLEGNLNAAGKTITCQKLVCTDYPGGGGGTGKYTEKVLDNIFGGNASVNGFQVAGPIRVINNTTSQVPASLTVNGTAVALTTDIKTATDAAAAAKQSASEAAQSAKGASDKVDSIVAGTQVLTKAQIAAGYAPAAGEVLAVNGKSHFYNDIDASAVAITCKSIKVDGQATFASEAYVDGKVNAIAGEVTAAKKAAEDANVSATTAGEQATAANTAAGKAETAAGEAKTAADNASEQATAASDEATKASNAAKTASEQATAANTAAGEAKTAATTASEQATAANTAAGEAKSAAEDASGKVNKIVDGTQALAALTVGNSAATSTQQLVKIYGRTKMEGDLTTGDYDITCHKLTCDVYSGPSTGGGGGGTGVYTDEKLGNIFKAGETISGLAVKGDPGTITVEGKPVAIKEDVDKVAATAGEAKTAATNAEKAANDAKTAVENVTEGKVMIKKLGVATVPIAGYAATVNGDMRVENLFYRDTAVTTTPAKYINLYETIKAQSEHTHTQFDRLGLGDPAEEAYSLVTIGKVRFGRVPTSSTPVTDAIMLTVYGKATFYNDATFFEKTITCKAIRVNTIFNMDGSKSFDVVGYMEKITTHEAWIGNFATSAQTKSMKVTEALNVGDTGGTATLKLNGKDVALLESVEAVEARAGKAETAANEAKEAAEASKTATAEAKKAATEAAASAEASKADVTTAKEAAETSKTAAAEAKESAEKAAASAETSKTDATAAKDAAEKAAASAETSKTEATEAKESAEKAAASAKAVEDAVSAITGGTGKELTTLTVAGPLIVKDSTSTPVREGKITVNGNEVALKKDVALKEDIDKLKDGTTQFTKVAVGTACDDKYAIATNKGIKIGGDITYVDEEVKQEKSFVATIKNHKHTFFDKLGIGRECPEGYSLVTQKAVIFGDPDTSTGEAMLFQVYGKSEFYGDVEVKQKKFISGRIKFSVLEVDDTNEILATDLLSMKTDIATIKSEHGNMKVGKSVIQRLGLGGVECPETHTLVVNGKSSFDGTIDITKTKFLVNDKEYAPSDIATNAALQEKAAALSKEISQLKKGETNFTNLLVEETVTVGGSTGKGKITVNGKEVALKEETVQKSDLEAIKTGTTALETPVVSKALTVGSNTDKAVMTVGNSSGTITSMRISVPEMPPTEEAKIIINSLAELRNNVTVAKGAKLMITDGTGTQQEVATKADVQSTTVTQVEKLGVGKACDADAKLDVNGDVKVKGKVLYMDEKGQAHDKLDELKSGKIKFDKIECETTITTGGDFRAYGNIYANKTQIQPLLYLTKDADGKTWLHSKEAGGGNCANVDELNAVGTRVAAIENGTKSLTALTVNKERKAGDCEVEVCGAINVTADSQGEKGTIKCTKIAVGGADNVPAYAANVKGKLHCDQIDCPDLASVEDLKTTDKIKQVGINKICAADKQLDVAGVADIGPRTSEKMDKTRIRGELELVPKFTVADEPEKSDKTALTVNGKTKMENDLTVSGTTKTDNLTVTNKVTIPTLEVQKEVTVPDLKYTPKTGKGPVSLAETMDAKAEANHTHSKFENAISVEKDFVKGFSVCAMNGVSVGNFVKGEKKEDNKGSLSNLKGYVKIASDFADPDTETTARTVDDTLLEVYGDATIRKDLYVEEGKIRTLDMTLVEEGAGKRTISMLDFIAAMNTHTHSKLGDIGVGGYDPVEGVGINCGRGIRIGGAIAAFVDEDEENAGETEPPVGTQRSFLMGQINICAALPEKIDTDKKAVPAISPLTYLNVYTASRFYGGIDATGQQINCDDLTFTNPGDAKNPFSLADVAAKMVTNRYEVLGIGSTAPEEDDPVGLIVAKGAQIGYYDSATNFSTTTIGGRLDLISRYVKDETTGKKEPTVVGDILLDVYGDTKFRGEIDATGQTIKCDKLVCASGGGGGTIPEQVEILGIGTAPTQGYSLTTKNGVILGNYTSDTNMSMSQLRGKYYITSGFTGADTPIELPEQILLDVCSASKFRGTIRAVGQKFYCKHIGLEKTVDENFAITAEKGISIGNYNVDADYGSNTFVKGFLNVYGKVDDDNDPVDLGDDTVELFQCYGSAYITGTLTVPKIGYMSLQEDGTIDKTTTLISGDTTIGQIIEGAYSKETGVTYHHTTTTITGDVTIGEVRQPVAVDANPFITTTTFYGNNIMKGRKLDEKPTLEVQGDLKIKSLWDEKDYDHALLVEGAAKLNGKYNNIGRTDFESDDFSTYSINTLHGRTIIDFEPPTGPTVAAEDKYGVISHSLRCKDYAHVEGMLVVGAKEGIEPAATTAETQKYLFYVGNGENQANKSARINLPTNFGVTYYPTGQTVPTCDYPNTSYGSLKIIPCTNGTGGGWPGVAVYAPSGEIKAKTFTQMGNQAEENGTFDYTYNPNYQTVATEGSEDAVYAPTAEKTPSICTSGAAYIGDNIITNGEYVAVVNSANTEQKTLIKNDSVETGKVKCSDPLQNDVLNRDAATQVILADIRLVCDGGDGEITVENFKFTFHRVTEFIVYIKAREQTRTVSTADAETARNSTFCSGVVIRARKGYSDFPTNISSGCSVSLPCKFQIGEKSTKSVAEYDANLRIQDGIMDLELADRSKDILETVRGTGKTFSSFGITGFASFVEAPSNNSYAKFNELF